MALFKDLDFQPIAQQVFEKLLIVKPMLSVEGLFREEMKFFIVAPSASEDTEEGRELLTWFNRSFAPAGHPIALTSQRPKDSLSVPIRS